MRIQSTDERKRLSENLCEATDENARSKALDRAARYYLRMCGGVAAYGRGNIQTLLDEAEAQGSLTAPEIAAILDERELSFESANFEEGNVSFRSAEFGKGELSVVVVVSMWIHVILVHEEFPHRPARRQTLTGSSGL